MIRFRAKIRSVTGKTRHLLASQADDALEITELPDPVAVELVEQDGAFYLFRLDEDDECVADTWHTTAEEAKAQANFEFGIEEADWRETETRHCRCIVPSGDPMLIRFAGRGRALVRRWSNRAGKTHELH